MADQTQGKPYSGNIRYLKEILKNVEDQHTFSADVFVTAEKEYKDLLSNKDIKCPPIPVRVVKVDNLSTKQLEDSPSLVQILKYASEKRFPNANNAWVEYLTLLEKKVLKQAQEKLQHKKQEDNSEQQQKEEQQQPFPNDQQKENVSPEKPETASPSTSQDDQMECEQTMNYKPISNLLKSEAAQNEEALLKEAQKEYTELLKQRGQQDTLEVSTVWQLGDIKDIKEPQQQIAPKLYEIISVVSGKTQEHWPTAVTEFIQLTSKLDSPDSDMTHYSEAQYVCPEDVSPIKYMLNQHSGTDDDLDDAHKDYIRLYTSESYLMTSFPAANFFKFMKCTIHNREEIQRELAYEAESYPFLYNFLENITSTNLNQTLCEQLWNDFARLLIIEKQLILAKNARGPNLDTNILVPRLDFEKLQSELQQKYAEVDELSTRLSRFASIQLTEGNPNIADLSDSHRPTKIGEMFSQLYDDEWSEAFEALKPKENPKAGDDDDEEDDDCFYPDILKQLQKIAMESYAFCSKLTQSQFEYAQKELAYITNLEMAPKTEKLEAPATSNDNEAPDTKPDAKPDASQLETETSAQPGEEQNKDEKTDTMEQHEQNKDEKIDTVDPHKQFIDRQAKEYRKASSCISSNKAAKIFEEEELPKIIISKEMLEDSRIKVYGKRCVQLSWYMCVQDPPMKMICLEKGEQMKKQLFSFFGRKGKTVDVCLWPALLLHEEGPVVSKGFVLPQK